MQNHHVNGMNWNGRRVSNGLGRICSKHWKTKQTKNFDKTIDNKTIFSTTFVKRKPHRSIEIRPSLFPTLGRTRRRPLPCPTKIVESRCTIVHLDSTFPTFGRAPRSFGVLHTVGQAFQPAHPQTRLKPTASSPKPSLKIPNIVADLNAVETLFSSCEIVLRNHLVASERYRS